MIFGVNDHAPTSAGGHGRWPPGCMERVIADAKAQGRKGCVLTCKDRLVHYYETFGFRSEGVSDSTHGGVVWYADAADLLKKKKSPGVHLDPGGFVLVSKDQCRNFFSRRESAMARASLPRSGRIKGITHQPSAVPKLTGPVLWA